MASIEKRTGKHGNSYRVREVASDGSRESRTFTDLQQARAYRTIVQADRLRGVLIDRRLRDTAFRDAAGTWLDSKCSLAPRTVHGYREVLECRVMPTFGNRGIGDIAPSDIRKWVAEMHAEGLSPVRIRHAMQALQGVLGMATSDGLIQRDPCKGIKKPQVRSAERPALTQKQLATLCNALDQETALVCLFAAHTGARWGEIFALRRGRVNLLLGEVEIAESVSEVLGKAFVGPTKSHRVRRLPLSASLKRDLSRHLEGLSGGPQAFVFGQHRDRNLPRSYTNFIRGSFKPAVSALIGAGALPDGFTFHCLRHTCATLLIAAGHDGKRIQRHMGHASIKITFDVYGHLLEDKGAELAETLEAGWQEANAGETA